MSDKKGRKKMLVGITGGIGAGKTALASKLRELGYPVLSADEIAREVLAPGSPALEEIRAAFGDLSLNDDGSANRSYLRSQISAHPQLRLKLDQITHPRIQARSQKLAEQAFAEGAELVFYEAPLLFEAGSGRRMDKVICVHAPDEVRIARTMKRDGGTREQAEKLLRSQMPQEEKMKMSDYLVENSSDLPSLEVEAKKILKKLKALST